MEVSLACHSSAALAVEGDDVEADQAIRFKIIKALEYPLVLAFGVSLGFHPALMPGKNAVKVAVLDEQQASRGETGVKIV